MAVIEFYDLPRYWTGAQWREAMKRRDEMVAELTVETVRLLREKGHARRAARIEACGTERVLVDPRTPERARTVKSTCGDRLCGHCYSRRHLKAVMPHEAWLRAAHRRGDRLYLITPTMQPAKDSDSAAQRALHRKVCARFMEKRAISRGLHGWVLKREGHRGSNGGWHEHGHFLVAADPKLKPAEIARAWKHAARGSGSADIEPVAVGELRNVLAYLAKPSIDQPGDYVLRGLAMRYAKDITAGGPAVREARRRTSRPARKTARGKGSQPLLLTRLELASRARAGEEWAAVALRTIDSPAPPPARRAAPRVQPARKVPTTPFSHHPRPNGAIS